MNRDKNQLTAQQVARAGPGWHADGNCLYLRVDKSPDDKVRRRFVVRVTRDGRKRDFGVGGANTTSLRVAREKRDWILAQLADGKDPIKERSKVSTERRFATVAQPALIAVLPRAPTKREKERAALIALKELGITN